MVYESGKVFINYTRYDMGYFSSGPEQEFIQKIYSLVKEPGQKSGFFLYIFPQIHRVHELHAALVNRVVVVLGKESPSRRASAVKPQRS